ncbi:hypothetical protein [Desulfopila sp. IMCC35008]|uniref:hypothetical protein n=1 Tax=Desulfopila sp. IMCC35008 TaxID=2653858 RepID=UPI0013D78011|nr:hypothetical protein [Desulfopila sp. IMCC35008]
MNRRIHLFFDILLAQLVCNITLIYGNIASSLKRRPQDFFFKWATSDNQIGELSPFNHLADILKQTLLQAGSHQKRKLSVVVLALQYCYFKKIYDKVTVFQAIRMVDTLFIPIKRCCCYNTTIMEEGVDYKFFILIVTI